MNANLLRSLLDLSRALRDADMPETVKLLDPWLGADAPGTPPPPPPDRLCVALLTVIGDVSTCTDRLMREPEPLFAVADAWTVAWRTVRDAG